MKKILVVSSCGKRRGTVGLIGNLLTVLDGLDKSKYQISLFDTDYSELNHNSSDYKVDHYYGLKYSRLSSLLGFIPRLRVRYILFSIMMTYI